MEMGSDPNYTVKIDPLQSGDLDAALALSTGEGWNQTAADWSRMLRLEPSGCFAARDGGRLAGTVTTTTYGRTAAWIGMMVVHPDYRRKGIGAALMQAALDHLHGLGIASVGLDATPAGRPLYESLGFVAAAEMERWHGIARPERAPTARFSTDDESRRAVCALDHAAYGVDRSRLLELLAAEGLDEPLVIGSNPRAPSGYAIARHGRAATYIGPIVAATASVAEQLLDGMLTRLAGQEVCLDRHRGGLLEQAALEERGLSKRRCLTRMHHRPRGVVLPAPSICLSAGPEFG